MRRLGDHQCGQLIDGDAPEGAGGGAVHAQQQLRRDACGGSNVPRVEQREPNEGDRVIVDHGFVRDTPGPHALQARSPIAIVLKPQVEQRVGAARRRGSLRHGQRRHLPGQVKRRCGADGGRA
jgi:hypothetical protein